MTKRQFAYPLLIADPATAGTARILQRISLKETGGAFDEAWLQGLIERNPDVLPIQEIEPLFTPFVHICRELKTASGYVDNLLVTPSGGLVLVECKLWRNAEARRAVLGQILDYAKDVSRWCFEDLEEAVRMALGNPKATIAEIVSRETGEPVDAAEFADALARTLRSGRFLLLIVGDGIREDTDRLVEYLQLNPAQRFAFALVELALFQIPESCDVIVQSRTLAKTVEIERGIVRIENGSISFESANPQGPAGSQSKRRETLTETSFFEALSEFDAAAAKSLRSFLKRVIELGIEPEYTAKSLIFRWNPDGLHGFNLAYVYTNGETRTDAVNWVSRKLGQIELSHRYLDEVAKLVPGSRVGGNPNRPQDWMVLGPNGKPPQVRTLLGRTDDWIAAMTRFMDDMKIVLERAGTQF